MNRRKKIIIGILIVILIIVIGIIVAYKLIENSVINRENYKFTVENTDSNLVNTISNEKDNKNEVDNTMEAITNINVSINGKKYNAKIENNETAQTFMSRLPQEFNMNELNGNEKYVYIDNSLPTNSSNPKHIESGDIMLYGSDCLVIFYKSFDTNYSYTRIGHIDNLSNLESDSIIAKFEK